METVNGLLFVLCAIIGIWVIIDDARGPFR
jgi:hypothetical protein